MAVVRVHYLPVFLIFIFQETSPPSLLLFSPVYTTYASQELFSFDCGVVDASLQH